MSGRRAGVKDARPVAVGDVDPMSRAAAEFALPLCDRRKGNSKCTRAVGHDESYPDHPGSLHVATGPRFVARAVWS